MPGFSAATTAATSASCFASSERKCDAPSQMFGRLKPRTKMHGDLMSSRATISSRTGSDAVAVSARIGGRPIASATDPSLR